MRPQAACAGLVLLLLACTVQDPVAVRQCTGTCGETRAGYCAGEGPPPLPDGAGRTLVCGGRVAAGLFRQVLCTCASYASSQAVSTDSYDSAAGAYAPGGKSGGVGINGKIDAQGPLLVGGSLWSSDPVGIQAGGKLVVAADLHDNGPLGGASASVQVGGDAEVAGDVRVAELSVGGALTLPGAAALVVSGAQSVGTVRRGPVSVPPPCPCAPAEVLDIAGYVEAHRLDNDNESAGLGPVPGELVGFSQDLSVELPCGRFYLERIEGTGALTVTVGGRTALFVGQGIDLMKTFRVVVAPGAELDLFVAGPVNTAGLVELGAVEGPARARFYIGGAGSINLSAPGRLFGNLYAPQRDLALSGDGEVFGSVFVQRVLPAGQLKLHHDAQVLRLGDGCPADPPR